MAEDHALQSFFELNAREPHDWQCLLKTVTRNRRKALRDWRAQGRSILARVRVQESFRHDVVLPSVLAEEFRLPGRGVRSLWKA